MTLKTLGTNANNSLSAFVVGTNDVISSDVATLLTQLRTDPPIQNGVPTGTAQQRINEAYSRRGILYLPNSRGEIKLRMGDYICWDVTTGWPIVVSGYTAANGPYTHS
jgi:hypothetical protein